MRPALLGMLVAFVAGCSAFQNMHPGAREAKLSAQQAHDMQFKVMRFADEYAGGVSESMGRLQKSSTSADERLAAQSWKHQQVESAYTFASGPNWVANSIDMVVLATLTRMVLEGAWVKEAYGDRAQHVLATHVHLEKRAWELVAGFLTVDQQDRLKLIIEEWRRQNPEVRAVGYIHFTDFAKSSGASMESEQKRTDSLFSLLRIDPFNSLDPAVREIAETRQLAERTIFYLQRAPGLLDMQIERMSYAFAVMPETKALLADFDRISLLGSAADRLVNTLPQTLATERHALIAQLMSEIEARSEAIGGVTEQLRATLMAGTDTANALHTTLESLDRITARFAAKPGAPATEKGPPFDIREYTAMLQQLTATTRELNLLAARVDGALPVVHQATEDAALRVEGLANTLFWRLVLLLAICLAMCFASALAYRGAVARLGWRAKG
jgi:hypothetical protein